MPKKVYTQIDNSDPNWTILAIGVSKIDDLHLRIIDAFASAYPIPLDDNRDPIMSKADWTVKHLTDFVVEVLRSTSAVAAGDAARIQEIADVTAEVEAKTP